MFGGAELGLLENNCRSDPTELGLGAAKAP
jgi:hypothetical protein